MWLLTKIGVVRIARGEGAIFFKIENLAMRISLKKGSQNSFWKCIVCCRSSVSSEA